MDYSLWSHKQSDMTEQLRRSIYVKRKSKGIINSMESKNCTVLIVTVRYQSNVCTNTDFKVITNKRIGV